MKLFSMLYKKVEQWSNHQHASRYLAAVSFSESSFFPIPPDVMLLPMSVTSPNKAWNFALVTTLASVFGALLGYAIGYWAFDVIGQWVLIKLHLHQKFEHVQSIFQQHGVWFILIAAFTPLPYKLFTIAAGVMHIALIPFVLASIVGRGLRFFLVAGLAKWFGQKYKDKLYSVIDIIGWSCLIIILVAVAIYLLFIR